MKLKLKLNCKLFFYRVIWNTVVTNFFSQFWWPYGYGLIWFFFPSNSTSVHNSLVTLYTFYFSKHLYYMLSQTFALPYSTYHSDEGEKKTLDYQKEEPVLKAWPTQILHFCSICLFVCLLVCLFVCFCFLN